MPRSMSPSERRVADQIESVLASHRLPVRVKVMAVDAGYAAIAHGLVPETLRSEIGLATGAEVEMRQVKPQTAIGLKVTR